jgi:acylphosphatase/uncharacterized protein YoxC
MEQRKCFEFTVKNKVQNVGLRLAIAKLIPDELDVRTDNMPDGSVRVVVKGYKKEVMEFWERLQKQVLGKAENPTFSQPAEMAEMSIETDRFFHKLQCEQMEKFVDVGLDMKSSIDGMSAKIGGMDGKFDGMTNKIDGMSGKIDGMSSKIDGMSSKVDNMSGKINHMSDKIDNMSSKIDHMSSRLDTLPQNMASELAKLKKKGLL